MSTTTRTARRSTAVVAAILAAAGLAAPAAAQRFQRLDGTQLGETSYDIERTRDRGYVTVGVVRATDADGTVNEDFYINKHRRDGSLAWTTRYGGQGRDVATSVHQTADGGYIVAGHTDSVGPTFGLALLRLDPFGTPIWANAYPADVYAELHNPNDPEYTLQPAVREVGIDATDPLLDFIVVSNITTTAGGQMGVYLRTDSGGLPLVHVAYMDPTVGPGTFHGFTDLKELSDGTIGITGFAADVDPIPGADPFVAELDILGMRITPAGFPIWAARYDEAGVRSFETGHGIDVGPNSGAFTIGAPTRREDATGLPTVGTDHLWVDPIGSGVMATHYTDSLEPSYAATRFDQDLNTVTAGFDRSSIGPALGVGFGSGVRISPLLGGVDWLYAYGPLGSPRDRLEAVAVGAVCGYAFTGPKTGLAFGADDQFMVKTNDRGDSDCRQLRLSPFEFPPDFTQTQIPYEPVPLQEWASWGQRIDYFQNSQVICFNNFCEPCKADFNNDGVLDNGDIQTFVILFLSGNLAADCNGDGILDNGDIAAFVAAFLAGCI